MILNLVHRITIINRQGESFVITNIGDNKNTDIGLMSAEITRNKGDISELCTLQFSSTYDVNGVIKLNDGSNNLKMTNQLPKNGADITIPNRYRDRFDSFSYEIGDIVIVELTYNENDQRDRYENFFGFVKNIDNTNAKMSNVIIENQCYHFRKFLFNFSTPKINVVDLMYKVIDLYNERVPQIYKTTLDGIKDSSLKTKVLDYLLITKVDKLINVDYDILNYRAPNCTGMDILTFLDTTYFTKSCFFQIPNLDGGKTYFIGGLFNLFRVAELTGLPPELVSFFDKQFIIKNYDLWYETIGLTDDYIIQQIRNQGIQITEPIFKYVITKNLAWQDARDITVRINFKIISKDNTTKSYSYGDSGGESHDVVLFDDPTKAQIEKFKDQFLNSVKFTGFKRNSSVGLLGHYVSLFDEIIFCDVYQNQTLNTQPYNLVLQKYFIQGVQTSYSSSGYRTTITLGPLLSSNIKIDNGLDNNSLYKGDVQRYINSGFASNTPKLTTIDPTSLNDQQLINTINAKGKRVLDNTIKFIPLRNRGQKTAVALNFYAYTTTITDPTNFVGKPTIDIKSNFVRSENTLIKPITDMITGIKTDINQAADIRKEIDQDKIDIDVLAVEAGKRNINQAIEIQTQRIVAEKYASFIQQYKLTFRSA